MIDDLIPEKIDSPTTESEKTEWLKERFNLERRLLISGNAHQLDKPDWWMALDATEHLVEILQKGAATPEVQIMLSKFLKELVNSGDSKTALALLGLPSGGGRPKKKLEELRAIDAYQVLLEAGEPDEAALEAAWQVYFPNDDIQKAKARPLGDSSAIQQQIEKTIKPLLHKAGVRKFNKVGRPKITKKTS